MFKKEFKEIVFSKLEENTRGLIEKVFLGSILSNKELNSYFFKKNINDINNLIFSFQDNELDDEALLKEKASLNGCFKKIMTFKKINNVDVEIDEYDFVYYVLNSDVSPSLKAILKSKKKKGNIESDYLSRIEKEKTTDKSEAFVLDLIKKSRDKHRLDISNEIEEGEIYPNLKKYTKNLTELSKKKSFKNIIGRSVEMEELTRILLRKNKNNPLIVGESGVGKTAMIEGLVYQIENKLCNERLWNKEVLSLDMTALTAGAKYRGDFEERFKDIVDEIIEKENILLFIDDIHTITSTTNSNGSSSTSLSNLLKPYLQSGELNLLGATTFDNYSKQIDDDVGFSRLFNKVILNKLSKDVVFEIVLKNKSFYEEYHKVKYSDNVIEMLLELSDKYMPNQNFPDKAFDILDDVGVLSSDKGEENVSILTLKEVLNSKIGIREDVDLLIENPLINLSNKLSSRIFGQDHVIEKIVNALILSQSGLIKKERPENIFLFLGSTGVGKTEIVKNLSKEIGLNLIRMDMSEYSDSSSVSKFLGSNPGFVGYQEGGKLTNEVASNPKSIILLDEIEKANHSIFNLLLQIFDNGFISDGRGRKIDFRHTMIIMTSNIGLNEENKTTMGFNESNSENYIINIEKYLPLEFINRIDEVINFNYLNKEFASKIADFKMGELKKSLNEKGYDFNYNDTLIKYIVSSCFDKKYGARRIEQFINKDIATLIAKEILFNPKMVEEKSIKLNYSKEMELLFE